MASKAWFVLKQTHYPPPTFPQNGTGQVRGSGPICLGHLIPDLQHLDNVINPHGPLDVPPDTPIFLSKAQDLTWEMKEAKGLSTSSWAGVPIAAAAGLTVKIGAGVAFKHSVSNYWDFESLETYIFQPTAEYIEDSIEEEDVSRYLRQRGLFKSSSMFMITGIIVARGAKMQTFNGHTRAIHGGPGLEFPLIAEFGVDVARSKQLDITATAQKTTDFVWAVRLAKVSKGLLDRQWSHETFSSGATFGLDEELEDAQRLYDALNKEGFVSIEKVEFGGNDEVFIIDTSSEEEPSIGR